MDYKKSKLFIIISRIFLLLFITTPFSTSLGQTISPAFFNKKTVKSQATLYLPLAADSKNYGKSSISTSINALDLTIVSGEASAQFDGVTGEVSGSRVNVTSNQTALNLGTGDYTFECWIYPVSVTSQPFIMDFRPQSDQTANYPAIRLLNTRRLRLQVISGGSAITAYDTTATIALSTWSHVALVRSGGVHKFYLNGVASGSYSGAQNFTVDTSEDRPQFGSSGWSFNNPLDGSMRGIKLWVGTAVYTSDFTP
jgi:hypothetical protein